jgi:hypothetical protein
MKTNILLALVVSMLCLTQYQASASHALAAGARYHARHSQYVELPFDKGDISYLLGYEYQEAAAFWQLLVGYAPSIGEGTDGRGLGVDSVVTPQINLFFEDRNWLAGVGVLASYIILDDKVIADPEREDDWTDVYWQVMLGYQIPLKIYNIEIMAYYPFEKWNTFRDFEGRDIEFGLLLKRRF